MRWLTLILLTLAMPGWAAIWYVDPTVVSSGAGTTPATAFKTTQEAVDEATLAAGDEVRLMSADGSSVDETPSARVDFDGPSGTLALPISFVGADSSGDALTSGYYTISGSSLPASTDLIYLTSSVYIFKRIKITAATRYGVSDANVGKTIKFDNVSIDNNASHGVYFVNTASFFYFINTTVNNNTGRGLTGNGAGRFDAKIKGCQIFDNGSTGIWSEGDGAGFEISNCFIYGNGGDGLYCGGTTYSVADCVIYNNDGDGFGGANSRGTITNVTSSSNGVGSGYGFNFTSTDFITMRNCHTYGNVSGAINGTVDSEDNQTGDPLFNAPGSGDFTPTSGSPLIGAGIGGSNIGAVAHAEGGGGNVIIIIED